MKFPDPKCPACRGEYPHKRSEHKCSVCGVAFATGHVAPEQNGMRICALCWERHHDHYTGHLPF